MRGYDFLKGVFGVHYTPIFKTICKNSTNAGLLLSQMFYYANITDNNFYKFSKPCGSQYYQNGDSWCELLCFSEKELRNAMQILKDLNFINSKRSGSFDNRTYYSLNFEVIAEAVTNALNNEQKQPVKAKTEPKEYKDTAEQEKQLKTQDLKPKTEKSEVKAETSKSENFNSLEKIKLPAFLDFEVWERFCKYRKEINKPVREMEAVNLFAIWKEWDKDGISVNECILQAMANNWKIVYRLDNAKKRTADLTADEIMQTQDLSFNPNFATESEKALFRFMQEQEQLKLENKEGNYAITTRQINSD